MTKPSSSIAKVTLACMFAVIGSVCSCGDDNPLSSREPKWTYLGVGDHPIAELEISGPYLYACAGPGGLFRASLRTEHPRWEYIGVADLGRADTTSGGPRQRVQDIAVADNGYILVAGTVPGYPAQPGVYRSVDGGATWEFSNSGMADSVRGSPGWINMLELCPLDRSTVFAGGHDVLFKSRDAGATWSLVLGVPYGYRGSFQILDVQCHPLDCNTIWASSMDMWRLSCSVAKSIDGGLTWERTDLRDWPGTIVFGIFLDPLDTDVVYIAMYHGGFIKTTDGGNSWAALPIETSPDGTKALAIDDASPKHIYVSADSVLYESWDGAETVEILESPIRGSITVMEYCSTGRGLYVGTMAGVYRYRRPVAARGGGD